MENPFRYGEVVRGAHFAGRVREKAELAADIRSGQNVVLISPRRYGKTSLVLEVLDGLGETVPHAYVDLLRVTSLDQLPGLLATAFAGMLPPVERALDALGRALRDLPLRPKFGMDRDGTPTVEFEPGAPPADVARTLGQLLEWPARIADARARRVAVVLDEFQSVVDLDPHLPATLRAVFQQQADVAHVFLGSKRHVLERLFTDEHEPMFRMAKAMPLGPLPRAEFAAFIGARFAATRSPIAEEAVARVLDLTGGHPHDTQELCYFLWALAATGHVFPVPPDLVDRALDRVLDAESARFVALWDRLRLPQRAALAAVAAEPGVGVYGAAYRRRHRLGEPSSVERSVSRLAALGVIEADPAVEGAYRVVDTFLPAWLRRLRRS
jgi:hypothetical protein